MYTCRAFLPTNPSQKGSFYVFVFNGSCRGFNYPIGFL